MNKLQIILYSILFTIFTFNVYAKDYSYYADHCEPIRIKVQEILEEVGVSKDYFFLLVAESHCEDKTSKAGARGVWQMMPATARSFGCDELNDIVCLTYAAANYLKHLELKCKKEDVIYCWHDGGTNFLKKRNRVPTAGAKGLKKQFNYFKKSFYSYSTKSI